MEAQTVASPVTPPSPTPAPPGLTPTRRTFLAVGASVAGVGVLAACGSGEPPADDGAAAGSGDTPAGPAVLVALADVPVGGAVSATTAAGDPVVVAQPEEGTVVAFSAVCTHQGCVVKPESAELHCPCHGSVFDAFTGENLEGPAPRPLDAVTVRVAGSDVVEG
jgi:Rieske Fe-S protein